MLKGLNYINVQNDILRLKIEGNLIISQFQDNQQRKKFGSMRQNHKIGINKNPVYKELFT